MRSVLPILLLAAFALPTRAEVVYLRDGKTLAGKITNLDAQQITLARCGAVEKIARNQVRSISLDSNAPESCGPMQDVLDLPAGTVVTVRVLDYIDSSHEPLGQTFRGAFTAALGAGQTQLPQGTRVVLRLVEAPGTLGKPVRTLDLIGLQVGPLWAEVSPAAAAEVDLPKSSLLDFDQNHVVVRGPQILIPSNTTIRFTFTKKAQLKLEKK